MQNSNTWRPVPDFPLYAVSDRGKVRSVLTQYVLTPRRGVVALTRDGKAHRCKVRDLVASAWNKGPTAPAGPEVSDVKLLSRDEAEPAAPDAPAEQSLGVDHAPEPDRTAVCFVLTAPLFKAELLDLAGEYDCLAEECDGLYADCAKLQDMAAMAEEQTRQLTEAAKRGKAVRDGLREEIGQKNRRIAELTTEAGELRSEKARLLTESESRQRTNTRLEETNDLIRAEIAKLKARTAPQPATAALSADEKDAEIARLRGLVDEFEAERAVYLASASI